MIFRGPFFSTWKHGEPVSCRLADLVFSLFYLSLCLWGDSCLPIMSFSPFFPVFFVLCQPDRPRGWLLDHRMRQGKTAGDEAGMDGGGGEDNNGANPGREGRRLEGAQDLVQQHGRRLHRLERRPQRPREGRHLRGRVAIAAWNHRGLPENTRRRERCRALEAGGRAPAG